ncbi:hypothetical transcriptional regulator [Planotetraspora thailandica]|uniref:Hypothetical transcriptional regulator n=1 Tax=Planotetraspora thailandica TaxID=487172 RepID=A0A8J3V5J8_9ACTN|nr:XRE family transcriptional regulator [Planotetraspora thailandica]GII57782.1 hypothetical transcriptional regulator [Planotetraspora thailandica]
MDEVNARVGARVRALRVERGLSLSALAAEAGVGKGSLSEIESGMRNATLATLYALAGPLGVPLASLLDDRIGAEVGADGVSARLLDARRYPDATVEVYALRLEPGADRSSPAHGPGVREHLLVTRGTIVAGPAGRESEIPAGRSSEWLSDVPHRYACQWDEPADAVLVITSPSAAEART